MRLIIIAMIDAIFFHVHEIGDNAYMQSYIYSAYLLPLFAIYYLHKFRFDELFGKDNVSFCDNEGYYKIGSRYDRLL